MDIHTFNQGIRLNLIRNWAWNATVNHAIIRKEFSTFGRGELDVGQLPRAQPGTPAIIIGSGPSLDRALPFLHKWEGGVFASPSHAKVLDEFERLPDYLVAVDSSCDVADKLTGPEYTRTILVTHPSIDPDVLRMWKWDKRYFLMQESGEWSDLQPALYPWIRTQLVNQGNVANTCITLAWLMGYDPIFLMGIDLGFPGNKKSCLQMKRRGHKVYWPIVSENIDVDSPEYIEEDGIKTTQTNVFYKAIMLANWKMQRNHLFSCSDGIVKEVPHLEPREVIMAQGRGFTSKYISPSKIAELADAYTIPKGMYAVMNSGKPGGIEMAEEVTGGIKGIEADLERRREIASHWTKSEGGWRRDSTQGSGAGGDAAAVRHVVRPIEGGSPDSRDVPLADGLGKNNEHQ